MELDPAEPWAHPLAAALDAMTLESWISAQPYCDRGQGMDPAAQPRAVPGRAGRDLGPARAVLPALRRRPGEDDRHRQQRAGDPDHRRRPAARARAGRPARRPGSGSSAPVHRIDRSPPGVDRAPRRPARSPHAGRSSRSRRRWPAGSATPPPCRACATS